MSLTVMIGSSYGAGSGTHRVTLYKHSSGALVFATGSYQWSWGLDANHDRSNLGSTTDVGMQQATVNLLADMGVQPATLQAGLVAASASTDNLPPTSSITSPVAGATFQQGASVTISGTAAETDGGAVGNTSCVKRCHNFAVNRKRGLPATCSNHCATCSGRIGA